MEQTKSDRIRLALIIWGVLIAQLFLYPGLEDTVTVLGGGEDIRAGMWFLVAEYVTVIGFAVLWGFASDSIGRRIPLVIIGSIGAAVTYLLIAAVPMTNAGFGTVIFLRMIGGIFIIGSFSISITMLMDLAGENGKNMGVAGSAIGFGAAIGSVVGGILADIDPLAPLYAGSIVFFICAVLASTITDNAPSTNPSINSITASLKTKPELAIPYTFGFLDRLTAGFFALTGVYYFREAFELGAAQAGITLAFFFLPFAMLQYPFGSASDHIGRFTPIIIGSALYGLTIIAIGFAPIYAIAALLMILVGVWGALVSPTTMALVTDIASPTERGSTMAGFNICGSLGFLTGFLIGGTATSIYGFLPAFIIVGSLEIIAAVVFYRPVSRLSSRSDITIRQLLDVETYR